VKITTFRKRLLSQHKAQQALFASTVKAMLAEHKKVPEAGEFIAMVTGLRDLLAEQTKGITEIWAAADLLPPGQGNRSPELMRPTDSRGPNCYDYLTAKRKMVEVLGDLDEWNKALACSSELMKAAKPFKETEPKKWEAAAEMSWQLGATQNQIHALARQTEAITATQEAILRTYGLRFWQGRKRWLRWEGDNKGE